MDQVPVAAPTEEPFGVEVALEHLRLEDSSPDIELVRTLIVAARQWVEQYCRRALVTQTWKVVLDAFPCGELMLPLSPVQSVSAIEYIAPGETTLTTWGAAYYVVATAGIRGRIWPAPGMSWPSTDLQRPETVEVEYLAGYGEAPTVPKAILQAMLLLIGHWYENREATISGTIIADVPMGVQALLGPYRVIEFA